MEDKRLAEFDKLLQDLNAATFALGVRDFFPGLKYLPKFLQNLLFSMDLVEGFKEKFLAFFDVSNNRCLECRDYDSRLYLFTINVFIYLPIYLFISLYIHSYI